MRVWFVARRHEAFSPASIERRRLGGGESALYHVAAGLARIGHEVVVVNRCGDEAGQYDGVRYVDAAANTSHWLADARSSSPDVVVICRAMEDVRLRIPARRRIFWSHDYQGVPRAPLGPRSSRLLGIAWRRATGPLFHTRVDRIIVISAFLGDVFSWLFGVPQQKLAVVPVGIDARAFGGPPPPHDALHFIHASVPDRGLTPLLQDIFPAIRAQLPGAELHVHSYQPLDAFARYATPGVHLDGWTPKSDLIQSLARSTLMLYPAIVEEMGCIAVLESMAAGTPAVTSSLGVLPELVGGGRRGIAVDGWPGASNFTQRYVDATVQLLKDPPRLAQMRTAAREYALTHHAWDAIVLRWQRVLQETLEGRPSVS